MHKIIKSILIISTTLSLIFLLGGVGVAKTTTTVVANSSTSAISSYFSRIWATIQDFWNKYIYSPIGKIWQRMKTFMNQEIMNRKPEINKEIEKELNEMKNDIPKVGASVYSWGKGVLKIR